MIGLPHAGQTALVSIEAGTYQITVEDGITVTAPRQTSHDIKRHKATNDNIRRPEPVMDVCQK